MARLPTVPPTAGLPLRLADLRPWGDADLAGLLAQWLGLPEVQLECSGTSALMVALRTLKSLSPGRSEVIVPAYTCPLVALAVAQCGLQLRLCDLRADALDMDPQALRALCGGQTLAILPTHLCGRVADVAMALNCARAVGAYVIEDAAQALGAKFGARLDGQPVGTLGDIGFYSLAVGKGLTTFEGGVLIARDAALREALRATSERTVRPSSWWELRRSIELLGYATLYRPAGLHLAYGAPLRQSLARNDWVEAAGDDFDDFIPQHRLGRWRQRVGARALRRLADFQRHTARQAQQRTFTAQRFGHQTQRLAADMQRRGVELHEFQITQRAARAPSHGQTVARGRRRVGGAGVNLPHATRGQNGVACCDQVGIAFGMLHLGSRAAALLIHQQV